MIWVTLAVSILIWAGWIAAIYYFTEPLAERLSPLVFDWWDSSWSDEWYTAVTIAACVVAVLAGVAGAGVWWAFTAVVL